MIPFRTGTLSHTIAHRGGAALWPENTLFGFESAHRLSVRTMELDVHLSADSTLVVCHDATVDRTTNGTGPIALKTARDLNALDAGYRFVAEDGTTPHRGGVVRIPTLNEVVEALPDTTFVVEMKPHGEEIARAMRRFIDEHHLHERICVAGFDEPTLAFFRSLPGRICRTSAGSAAISRFYAATRVGLAGLARPRATMIQVPRDHRGIRVVDRLFVDAAHRLDIEVHVWTIDDEKIMRELLELGVDAVITDRPDRMVRAEAALRLR